ncbi:MAG: alpha-galactosidase [Planctomycetes bacterium]|nr:alpha-galactosidase [Planctomycetota bacterium]
MMRTLRLGRVVLIVAAGSFSPAGEGRAARPTPEEMAARDRWVAAHFPARAAGAAGPSAPEKVSGTDRPSLMVWANLDRVFQNSIRPDLPLAIAGRKFEHGLYCHAPSRVQVLLPGPARSFSAVVGILTNPASQGGSVVCSVRWGEKEVFASPVLRRGEPGVPIAVDLAGAREFFLVSSSAGDGLYSDQTVWGDATVTRADGEEVRLGDLPLRDPFTRERAAAAPPFSFSFGGRHSDELLPSWMFREERDASKPGRTERTRTYTDPRTGLIVRVTVIEYADFPTVEWTLTFRNAGQATSPPLGGILPLDTHLERGEKGEFLLHHFVGSPCAPNDYQPLETVLGPNAAKRITTAGGRPTNSDLPYFNIETGPDGGVISVIGWAGQWAAQFSRDAARGLRLTGGQEATWFRLAPGEEVRSPLAVLQFYRGDWIRAQNVWRSWMLAHNVPRRDGRPLPPFIYVCNGNYYPGLMTDAATEMHFLRRYLEEGIRADYWDQDAGWYPCDPVAWPKTGTWEVDRKRWPNGIREVSDYLKSNGTGSILWFEPERVHSGTWLAENHPEWIHGGRNGGLVRLDVPECRAWITDRVDRILTEEGIDFYRQDFNMDPLYSWRGNDQDDRLGITEIRHIEGYFAHWDELVRRHPKLWIDTCASGGRRNDLETLRRAVPILRSDFVGDPLAQQNHIHGISFWMPYHGSGFGTIDTYDVRSLSGPITGIGVDTRRKDLDYDLLRRLYREIRRVQPCFLGDYYPLTPYRLTADVWCARQFDRPDAGDGVVQAFRRKDCPDDSAAFRLRGLDPGALYELVDLDGEDPRRVSGRELMETGLTVTAKQPRSALTITYRRLARDADPNPERRRGA